MSDDDNIIVSTAERIFRRSGKSQKIIHTKGDRWKQPLWHALTDAGLPLAWVPEVHGGWRQT